MNKFQCHCVLSLDKTYLLICAVKLMSGLLRAHELVTVKISDNILSYTDFSLMDREEQGVLRPLFSSIAVLFDV